MPRDETIRRILAEAVPERSPLLVGYEPSTVPLDLESDGALRTLHHAIRDATTAGSEWRIVLDDRGHVAVWKAALDFWRPPLNSEMPGRP